MEANEKIVDMIAMTGDVIRRYEEFYQQKLAEMQKIAAEIPATVELVTKSGMIENNEQQALAQALRDPVKAQKLLQKAAQYLLDAQHNSGRLGQPVPGGVDGHNKSASFNGNGNGESGIYRGGRRSAEPSPAWFVAEQRLGMR
jgi:hypothetical protein